MVSVHSHISFSGNYYKAFDVTRDLFLRRDEPLTLTKPRRTQPPPPPPNKNEPANRLVFVVRLFHNTENAPFGRVFGVSDL